MNKKIIAIAVAALAGVLVAGAASYFFAHKQESGQAPAVVPANPAPDAAPQAAKALAALQEVLAAYRKITVGMQ